MKKFQTWAAVLAVLAAASTFAPALGADPHLTPEQASSLPLATEIPARGGVFWVFSYVHCPGFTNRVCMTPWPSDPFGSEVPVYDLDGSGRHFIVGNGPDDLTLGRQQQLADQALHGLEGRLGMDSPDSSSPMGLDSHSPDDLWLEIIAATNDLVSTTANLLIHAPEPSIFDLFYTESLPATNGWYWVARALPGETNIMVPSLPLDAGFFILGTTNGDIDPESGLTAACMALVGAAALTNDFNNNGIPDIWEVTYFGNLSQPATNDYDGDGVSDLAEYLRGTDPNKINFSLPLSHQYVNTSQVPLVPTVWSGVPASMAVLVNSTNFDTALWQPYNPAVTASIGTNDGDYEAWLGLCGRAPSSQQAWVRTVLTLDTVPPLVIITNPVAGVTASPFLQLQGYSIEPLSSLSYDLTNATRTLAAQPGCVTRQHVETNSVITTNWFQCYDIPLAEGANAITLHATDLAGNVTTTNLTITLDYSIATNPPAITLVWPPDQAVVAGTNLTFQGYMDDPSCSVSLSVPGADPIPGTVDRDGRFRIPNVPVSDLTNTFTIAATNVGGWGSAAQAAVSAGPVSVTMTPLTSAQVSQPYMTITGMMSDSSYALWVNGMQAAVNPDGSWEVDGLPVHSQNGTGQFDIGVYPADGGPGLTPPVATQSLLQDMPSLVRATAYSDVNWGQDLSCGGSVSSASLGKRSWELGVGGQTSTHTWITWITSVESETDGVLGADWPPFLTAWQNGAFGTSSWSPETVDCSGSLRRSSSRTTQTSIELVAAGPAQAGEQRLVRLTVSAAAYSGYGAYWDDPGDIPLLASVVSSPGLTFTSTATNANVAEAWVSVPAGSVRALPLIVTGTDFSSTTGQAEDVKLSIQANGIPLDGTTVVSNANFCVGQILTFSTNEVRVPAGIATKTVQWTFDGNYLNASNLPCADCSVNYTTNSALLTNETTSAWWVSGSMSPPATYSARLTETLTLSNGSLVVVSGKGMFSMLRPTPTFNAEVRETVRVDTDWFWSNDRQQQHPGTNLHFGIASAVTNEGIAFVYASAPLKPDTTETYGKSRLLKSSRTGVSGIISVTALAARATRRKAG